MSDSRIAWKRIPPGLGFGLGVMLGLPVAWWFGRSQAIGYWVTIVLSLTVALVFASAFTMAFRAAVLDDSGRDEEVYSLNSMSGGVFAGLFFGAVGWTLVPLIARNAAEGRVTAVGEVLAAFEAVGLLSPLLWILLFFSVVVAGAGGWAIIQVAVILTRVSGNSNRIALQVGEHRRLEVSSKPADSKELPPGVTPKG